MKWAAWSVAAAVVLWLCSLTVAAFGGTAPQFVVALDAGHGGIDGGVSVGQVKESDMNLDYCKTLQKTFESCGVGTVLTRKTREGLYGLPTKGFKLRDMRRRVQIITAASADVAVSVHMNKFGAGSRSGPQTFYQKGSAEGKALAESIQHVFNAFTGNNHEAQSGDFYICRESPCPAVIVECGFFSNAQDFARLQTEQYRQLLCDKIFRGVMLFLYQKGVPTSDAA